MRFALAAALAFFVLGCSKCGEQKPKEAKAGAATLARRIPKGITAAVLAPDALAVGEALEVVQGLKFANFAAALQGFSSAQEYADALIRQVGFDVRSAAALEKAGVDPDKGLAVVVTQTGDNMLVLGASQPTRIGAALRTLATERLGAGVYEKQDKGGIEVHTLARAQGLPARIAYVVVDGFVVVASDPSGVDKLTDWARLAQADSLEADLAFSQARERLPKEHQLLAWVPAGSPALLGSALGQVAASGSLDSKRLRITVDAPAGEALSAAAFTPLAAPQLVSLLPADSFLVARFSGDPAVLSKTLKRMLGPRLLKAFADAGLDVDAQVLQNLKPGGCLSLALSPRAQLGGGLSQLDASTNPFNFVQLAGALEAKDAAKVQGTLRQLAAAAPSFGAKARQVERPGAPLLFETRYHAGEGVHFGAQGARVAFGNPLERVEAVLRADGKGPPPIADPALAKTLEARAAAVVVDLRKLAGQVQALPSEAWGVGGFAIKASTLRWLDATDDLMALSLFGEAKGQFVQGQLELSLKAAEPKPAEAAPR